MQCENCEKGDGFIPIKGMRFKGTYYAPYIACNHMIKKCPVCGKIWLVFDDPSTGKTRWEEVIDPLNDLEKIH